MTKKLVSTVATGLVAITLVYAVNSFGQSATRFNPANIPVSDFFRTAKLIDPELSPDGRYVAVGVEASSGRVMLAVVDLANPGDTKVVANFSDGDVVQVAWVNTERLVFSIRDLQWADRRIQPGLWAVNKDGSDFRQLIQVNKRLLRNESSSLADHRLSWEWSLHRTLRDGSADVIVEAPTFDNTWEVVNYKLARLDTQTGRTKALDTGAPAHAMDWIVDGDGGPAAVMAWYKGRFTSYVRQEQGWKLWEDVEGYTAPHAMPYWAGPNNMLLAQDGRATGTKALYTVNRGTLKLSEKPILSLSGYDFTGSLIYDDKAKLLLGVRYEIDARGTAWLDSGMQEVQAEIDKLLPSTVNSIYCLRCASVPVALVHASSDRAPPTYFIYHRDTKKLQPLGASRPWINASQMAHRDMYRFEARDKHPIPVLVTQPLGNADAGRPAVVLVHGGPYVRGTHWQWEPMAQFLASRGYVVIEPEFRGSTGYGFEHFHAGWKQWGLAMQDDVADSVQWAAKKGWVDPARVCIAGASYGGYAVLMGLIKDPDIYKCGVNWVGVSDINLMYDIGYSDSSNEWKHYGMPLLVGDQVKDAQQLKATSPLEQASRLQRPLLMAYGGTDRRIPLQHGTAFRDAVSKTNKDVEWVVYPNEGHGWRELDTNIDFWTRVEKFLDRNIGHPVDKQ